MAGFFTFGVPADRYDLPHPKLGAPVILLIRRVLLRAFALLRERDFPLATATEDEVTTNLRSIIENDFRQTGIVAGFNRRTYEHVVRHGQAANYDNSCPTKTPDLCFKLRDDACEPRRVLSEFDALFVECKPVDATHPVTSKYCDGGLIRFVRGYYAWAMQEGMMLAYARHGRTIAEHLHPAMSRDDRKSSLETLTLPTLSQSPAAAACENAEAVHVSLHQRSFTWLDGKGPATPIQIYHLWHKCD